MTRLDLWTFLVWMLCAGAAFAQNVPNKPVRIVTTAPGSANDLVARLIAPGLTGSLGRQVIVDNRGPIAGEIVAKSPPDGHTLLSYGSSFWLSPFMRDNVPWDPVKDFSPIALTTNSPDMVVAHPSLPVKSVKELIALAKARPGELNYGSSVTGSTPHLAAELFKSMARVDIVRVPYKGVGPALVALIGGHVEVMFPNAGAAAPHIKSGRLKALAVASARPSPLTPGLPTVASSGLPGYESSTILGMFAPAGTPPEIVDRLNQAVVRALHAPDVKKKLFSSSIEVVASSPHAFAATLKSDMAKWGKVIRDAGIRGE